MKIQYVFVRSLIFRVNPLNRSTFIYIWHLKLYIRSYSIRPTIAALSSKLITYAPVQICSADCCKRFSRLCGTFEHKNHATHSIYGDINSLNLQQFVDRHFKLSSENNRMYTLCCTARMLFVPRLRDFSFNTIITSIGCMTLGIDCTQRTNF